MRVYHYLISSRYRKTITLSFIVTQACRGWVGVLPEWGLKGKAPHAIHAIGSGGGQSLWPPRD
jgi:hypothetical protein